jgi:hypothetical protein
LEFMEFNGILLEFMEFNGNIWLEFNGIQV